jgi:spore cortex formation protein SpoVR/YcgB (stage V sporulation)
MIVNSNPSRDFLVSLLRLIKLVSQHVNFDSLFVLDNQVFLSQVGQPDIIMLVPYDEARLKQAFSSLGFLTSIKQDSKILDFRFRNPVLR